MHLHYREEGGWARGGYVDGRYFGTGTPLFYVTGHDYEGDDYIRAATASPLSSAGWRTMVTPRRLHTLGCDAGR